MSETSGTRIAAMFAIVYTAYLPLAWADGCTTQQEREAAAQFRKTEDVDRTGKLKETYALLEKVDYLCLDRDGNKRHEAMRKRIGLQLGQQEEKPGRLAEAFDWYKRSGNVAEADRVKMKQVDTRPRDRNLVSGAIDYFRYRNNDARVAQLRQLAAKNAEFELANEEKAFAARKESFQELDNAKDWFYLVNEAAAKKVRERAEQRGDTLFKEVTHRRLEIAQRYYSVAEAGQKEKALQDKALRLAQESERRGEITQAKDFYHLAGATTKGDELEQNREAQHIKSEEKRQKNFKKEQDDLEKQLGM